MILGQSQTQNDLRPQCGEKLLAMKPALSARDKADAMIELRISRPTLDKYLGGDVSKLETGLDLVKFFTTRMTTATELLSH